MSGLGARVPDRAEGLPTPYTETEAAEILALAESGEVRLAFHYSAVIAERTIATRFVWDGLVRHVGLAALILYEHGWQIDSHRLVDRAGPFDHARTREIVLFVSHRVERG